MENVLEVYQRPYNPANPMVCMDEASKQLVSETRTPIDLNSGRPKYYDYEYERKGTANLFMWTEPLAGWRKVRVTDRRTREDWAQEVRELLDEDYPEAKRVTLVMDNLNTHHVSSLYEAFDPGEARRLMKRLEVVYTPKHGSWLNMAEIELNVVSKQCLSRRIGNIHTLRREVAAWEKDRNESQSGVDWRFTTAKARIKLKRLYPRIKTG